MKDYFNAVSLATLTKAELQTMLATYKARLQAASENHEQAPLQSQIAIIQRALSMK